MILVSMCWLCDKASRLFPNQKAIIPAKVLFLHNDETVKRCSTFSDKNIQRDSTFNPSTFSLFRIWGLKSLILDMEIKKLLRNA